MVLWVDKYRPRSLDELTYHPKITERLAKMVSTEQIPHLLFFGPSGAGVSDYVTELSYSIQVHQNE